MHTVAVDNHSHLHFNTYVDLLECMNMYVCLCNGITERSVRQAAAEGVCSLSELTRRTGCADSCGSCADLAEQILRDEHQRQAFSLPIAAAA